MTRKKLLKQVIFLLVIISLIVPGALTGRIYAAESVYDFNNLGEGLLNGQDNWVAKPAGNNTNVNNTFQVLTPGVTTAFGKNYSVTGHDGTKAARFPYEGSGIQSKASRVNDGNFSIPAFGSGDIYVIEFEMQHPYWGSAFGLGYDANGDKDIDNTELGFNLFISGYQGIRRLDKPDGTSVNGTDNPALGAFNRYQVIIDRLANGGAGSASVWFLNLDNEGNSWRPITGLQNIDMGFDTGTGNKNPLNWNGMCIFSDRPEAVSLFDSISVRWIKTSARTVTFSDTGIGSGSSQTITLDGENLSGNLSASLTGEFEFEDGSAKIENVTNGSSLTIKFVPDETGNREGALTLQGDDMAAPFTIPLNGNGVTDITAAGVTGVVAPAAGGAPIAAGSLTAGDASYTVTDLEWQNGGGSPATLTAGEKFKSGSTYQAVIELTAAVGYKFQTLTPSVDAGTAGGGTINVDAEGNKLTFTVTFSATATKTVTEIEITNQPTKLIYTEGTDGTLALNGMVVTETYNDGTTGTVTFTDGTATGYTANPANGTTLTREDHNNTTVAVTHTSSGETAQTGSLTVNPEPTYGISLDKTGTHTFAGQTAGYVSVTPLTVTVSNMGNQATGDLTVALSGTNPGSYTLSKTTVGSMAASGSDTFTVAPNTGLSADTYTATVTVSGGGNITEQAFTLSFTVDPAPVVNATISPDSGSFDKYVPADVQTTITWGSATGVTDVKAGGSSIGAGNYNVLGNMLTVKKEYLATQSTGSLVLTVEFNTGAAATLPITVSNTTPPTIDPISRNYDLHTPADVYVTIAWHSAVSVTDVVYSISPDSTLYTLNTDDYTVVGNDLTIEKSFFSGLSLTTGAALDFDINFNTGATAALAVNVVDSYVPGSNADLSSLSVNGTPVSGFHPDDIEYDVELPYGSLSVTVTATVDDPLASRVITDAPLLPGSATVTVTAEDGITTKTYTINFTIGAAPTVPVTSITVTGTAGSESVQVGNTLQMLADVLPLGATDNSVTWSIKAGSGATINTSGLLTATAAGTVTVRATANDSSGIYGERIITINATFTHKSGGGGRHGSSITPQSGKTITVTETSSELFSGNAGEISANANMENAFSNSVEVKVTGTVEDEASFKFGAGDGVYPFDISLYIKDTNEKTQPAPGYAVTISLPVPGKLLDKKDLLSVVHKSDSGVVTTLASRIEQRDGVWYLVFEATEFSPYALVVRSLGTYDESAGVPYYLGADGHKVFIGFTANGKYIAPSGMTIFFAHNAKSFADVPGHWAAGNIDFVTEREIFLGTGSNTFSPNTGMTRAMFATVIGRLYERSYGGIESSGAHAFTDCNYGDYYGKYVDWAAENHIIGGYGNGAFGPDDAITREQMAVILYRLAYFLDALPNDMDAELNYPDAGNISSYAKKAALYCQTTGVISGRTGGMFAPKETASRAEVATIIKQFVESVME